MKLMHQAMYYGSQQQTHEGDENNTTEKRVNGGKHFRARISKRIDGPHAAQDHRRLQQRVDPVEIGKPVIAADSDGQSNQQQTQRQPSGSEHSLDKDRQRRYFFMSVFEHLKGVSCQLLVVSSQWSVVMVGTQ
jgi:hypothetical protein